MTIDTPPIIQLLNDHVLTEHENECVLFEVRNFNDFEAVSIQCPNCRIDRFAVHSYSQTQTDAQITKNISDNDIRSLGRDINSQSLIHCREKHAAWCASL